MPGVMLMEEKGLLIGVPVYFALLMTMLWRACKPHPYTHIHIPRVLTF